MKIKLLAGVPHDKDAEDVRKYAEQHPEEDQELEKGGVDEQQQGGVPGQEMESGRIPEERSLRSSSSMTLHPRGALRPGEALQLLQGGDGQPMEGVEQGQRRELPEGAEESARKSQRFDENTEVPEPESKKSKTLYPPTFAGQVRRVIEDVEIYVDEERLTGRLRMADGIC